MLPRFIQLTAKAITVHLVAPAAMPANASAIPAIPQYRNTAVLNGLTGHIVFVRVNLFYVQRRNELSGRSAQERTEVEAERTKCAASAKVMAAAASKTKLKTTKVCVSCFPKFLSHI